MVIGSEKHVALDMDDVCLDFVGGLIRAAKTEHNVDIDPESITDFNLRPFLDPVVGQNWWKWLRERPWIWSEVFGPVNGAIGGIERLRREGYYLEIVTSKPQWAEPSVWRWLGKWRLPVQRVTIVDHADKDLRKVDVTDARVIVDDKPENVQGFLDEGRRGIIFDRPHNRSIALPGAERAKDWSDVYAMVKSGAVAR